jgi:pimeloyl-ACP methyl ester carboxylesterase
VTINEGRVTANGVDFAYLDAGAGPLALCLHGFPDCAWTWRHLLPVLADAGFRAVAPFMRGYAPTAVPADGRYQTGALVADACALHDVLGGDGDAVLIGHDWGAAATYGAAVHAPDRWRRVVAAAVPPAGIVGRAFLESYDQLQRSWYMFFFQHALADLVVPAGDLAFVERLWSDWSPGYDASADLPEVKDALRGPANLAAALGYYRATLGAVAPDPALAAEQAATQGVPTQPTLYLHGADDGCIGVELADGVGGLLPGGSRVEVVDGTGHFLHLERPGDVGGTIVEFLAG